ncbi:hypothetical protein OCK74_06440 [Chitinophagaceae bacterium LB-8]|uniref:Uncharacterized protein n=1 Tax=Paraflavisolibacter caeni TaxID=2982496 RepID=A0A9X2XUS5_9BACT|nr:hypothetical protein [Paraflavisolibacter caeni]MCU7548747.1 hypothetical protein [Paraflavisolibacter caeni]
MLYTTLMKLLQLPPTIRTARPDEVPKRPEFLDKITASKAANIVEGYVFHYNESHDLPFRFFAEINVDNKNLWTLFKTLFLQLPEEICLVYNYKDDEPTYSGYTNKYEVLNKLEQFNVEITQDGFLEIGALFNDENFMEEVFIRSPKYLQYWGVDEERFRKTMTEFELYEVPALNFIDEYPLVTEALRLYNSDVRETNEVLEQLGTIILMEE